METSESLVIAVLLTAVGGAVGATITKGQTWRGAVVGLVSIAASILMAVFGLTNPILLFLTAILSAGIVGGALKFSNRQLPSVGLGALFGYLISQAITGSF